VVLGDEDFDDFTDSRTGRDRRGLSFLRWQ
jgi:hypothetical protein